jgi:hypothetical protein
MVKIISVAIPGLCQVLAAWLTTRHRSSKRRGSENHCNSGETYE